MPPIDQTAASVANVLDELTAERRRSSPQAIQPAALGEGGPKIDALQLEALARRCAPGTPVNVVTSLIAGESGGRPLVLAENGRVRIRYRPGSRETATALLTELEARGASVDVGLMQLNTSTLHHMGVAAAEALDPCRNIALGAKVFDAGYAAAFGRRQPTLMLLSAYSTYNTGDPERGVRNGYADRAATLLRTQAARAGKAG